MKLRLAAAALAAALLLAACSGDSADQPAESPAAAAPPEKSEIVFSDLNWISAWQQVRIAAFIVEHGYQYPVRLQPGDTVLLWDALIEGDVDVTMEVWLPNVQHLWDAGLASGDVIDAGNSLDDTWQAFGIPRYVKDANPGLVSVADLPDYKHLFATAGSHGKARLLNCIPGWACEQVNTEKIASYGLGDHVQAVNPGSEAALVADARSAFADRQPWLGYVWAPSQLATLDFYRLEEPPYSGECWESGKACAYPEGSVEIAARIELRERAPDVLEFLGNWSFPAKIQIALQEWMEDNNETVEAAAIHYLRTRRDLWTAMVPPDVAERVDAALAERS